MALLSAFLLASCGSSDRQSTEDKATTAQPAPDTEQQP